MHVVKPRADEALTIKLPDGRIFRVTFRDGGAHVPEAVGRYLIDKGYAVGGSEPNPKPRWEMRGDTHGDPIPMFDPWCMEISQSEKEKIND
jgi:hypothetical protein